MSAIESQGLRAPAIMVQNSEQDESDMDHDQYSQGEIDLQAVDDEPQQAEFACCSGAFGHQDECANKDPRTYGEYPSCWIQKIVPAGRTTFKSESVYNVINFA